MTDKAVMRFHVPVALALAALVAAGSLLAAADDPRQIALEA